MLLFDRPTRPPAPGDLVWVFRGRELVGSLLGSPGAPIPHEEVTANFSIKEELIPVGYLGDDAVFAGVVDDPELNVMRYVGTNLFGLIGRIEESMFDAIGRAYQLLNWDRDHRHCGRCGSTTQLADKGQCRQCETCNLSVYPRLSPCVIVLVTRGGECLLAAAAGGNRRFYSALAGFVEPGEPLEDRRPLVDRNPRPVVVDHERHGVGGRLERHPDLVGRMAGGVVEQVTDHSGELVDPARHATRRHPTGVDRDPPRPLRLGEHDVVEVDDAGFLCRVVRYELDRLREAADRLNDRHLELLDGDGEAEAAASRV